MGKVVLLLQLLHQVEGLFLNAFTFACDRTLEADRLSDHRGDER